MPGPTRRWSVAGSLRCEPSGRPPERDVLDSTPAAPMGEDELQAMVAWFAEQADRFARAMEQATPEARQALYDSLGLRAYWTPGVDAVEVTVPPGDRGANGVSEGGLEPPRPIRAPGPQPGASAYSATPTWWTITIRPAREPGQPTFRPTAGARVRGR
jgi:hypothetical protein